MRSANEAAASAASDQLKAQALEALAEDIAAKVKAAVAAALDAAKANIEALPLPFLSPEKADQVRAEIAAAAAEHADSFKH